MLVVWTSAFSCWVLRVIALCDSPGQPRVWTYPAGEGGGAVHPPGGRRRTGRRSTRVAPSFTWWWWWAGDKPLATKKEAINRQLRSQRSGCAVGPTGNCAEFGQAIGQRYSLCFSTLYCKLEISNLGSHLELAISTCKHPARIQLVSSFENGAFVSFGSGAVVVSSIQPATIGKFFLGLAASKNSKKWW